MSCRVVAVVVTWNRRDLLAESLTAVTAQTLRPVAVVVVDNASSDGTRDMLASEHPTVDVVQMTTNVGGAGGFAAGISRALTHQPDLVWLLDDDTVPVLDALERLAEVWGRFGSVTSEPERPGLVASRVVWVDGRDHPMNTPRASPFASREQWRAATAVGAVPIRSASFVSIAVDAGAIRESGLPIADYFLWNDDFEYTTRLLRHRTGLYCPGSLVVHKTAAFGGTDVDPGERFFYEVRNKAWLFLRSTSLTPAEKVVYAGSTARRWARTYRASADRQTLRRGLVRGLAVGLRTRPRPNAAVLELQPQPSPQQPEPEPRPAPAGPDDRSPSGGPEPFSLLLSTYGGDRPDFLREAFVSTVQRQTRRPHQVVLVQDGPVPDELALVIAALVEESPVPVAHVVLEANAGLGPALDLGLATCEHEIVARMDADDISRPDRFEKQLPLIEAGADLVGSGLLEFESTPEDVVGRRTPPTDPDEIRRVITFRDPFNHPTVVYRRSAVLAAGGYTDMALMEDYLLFTRMITAGARPGNIAEPLVYYRVGAGAYARRGGMELLRSELALQRWFRRLGITSRSQYVRNVAVRGGYRLVPESLRRMAYRRLIANRGNQPRSNGEPAAGR